MARATDKHPTIPGPLWTETNDATLRRMWGMERTIEDIAAAIGCHTSTVRQRRKMLGLPARNTTVVARVDWPEEHEAILTRLWNESDLTALDIAEHLNQRFGADYTKNAVIGKKGRLKLKSRTPCVDPHAANRRQKAKGPRKLKAKRPGKPLPPRSGKVSGVLVDGIIDCPRKDNLTLIVDNTRDGSIPLHMLSVTGQCRWPYGTPGAPGFGFCGCKTASGAPYCVEHAAIAYQPKVARAATHPIRARG